jgi:hypothetical protein
MPKIVIDSYGLTRRMMTVPRTEITNSNMEVHMAANANTLAKSCELLS